MYYITIHFTGAEQYVTCRPSHAKSLRLMGTMYRGCSAPVVPAATLRQHAGLPEKISTAATHTTSRQCRR